ncbi:MAG: Uma2 family endonuclease [Myxococcales bacterium]|nr:Uma2 family endonuclease [Myxococcales bacterium]
MAGWPARRKATYEDLSTLPGHVVGELVDGELYTSPRPATLHARTSSRLGSKLGGPFDEGIGGPGGWIILDEPELHLVGQVVVPDLAGWRRERMPELPDAPYIELAPDWVCEVLSMGTEAFDRAKKMPVYAQAGVRHAWLLDPDPQIKTLEVFRLEGKAWVLLGTHTEPKVRAEPFDAIEIELAALWAR